MKSDCEAVCLFCRERISYIDREKKYFIKHLKCSHSIKYNLSYVIAINFLGQESRDIIVSKFEESIPTTRSKYTEEILLVEDDNTKNSELTKENQSTAMEYAEIEIDGDDEFNEVTDKPNSSKVFSDIESAKKENEIKLILLEENTKICELTRNVSSKGNNVNAYKVQPDTEGISPSCQSQSGPMNIVEEKRIAGKLANVENIVKSNGIISDTKSSLEIWSSPGNRKRHEDGSKSRCDICEKAVSIVSKLMSHAKSHCKKNDTEKDLVVKPEKIHLPSELSELANLTEKSSSMCVMCQRAEGTIKKLRMHAKTHRKKLNQEKCEADLIPKCDKMIGLSSSSINRKVEKISDSFRIEVSKNPLDLEKHPNQKSNEIQSETKNEVSKGSKVADNMKDQIAAVLGL